MRWLCVVQTEVIRSYQGSAHPLLTKFASSPQEDESLQRNYQKLNKLAFSSEGWCSKVI